MFCPFFKENSVCCSVVVYFSDGSPFYTKRLIASWRLVSLSLLRFKAIVLKLADCSMSFLAPSLCICTTNKEIALEKNNEDSVDKFDSSFAAR